MEERLEEQENDAENLEEEKSRLNDKIGNLKKDVEGLEDNLKKVSLSLSLYTIHLGTIHSLVLWECILRYEKWLFGHLI